MNLADGVSESQMSHTFHESAQSEMSRRLGGSDTMNPGMKSVNFFAMSGIPKFGKNWLDNFIPDEQMQSIFMTSEVVRNVAMLQCVYYASLYNDLWLYKHSFVNRGESQLEEVAAERLAKGGNVSMRDLQGAEDVPPFRVGIIGCG